MKRINILRNQLSGKNFTVNPSPSNDPVIIKAIRSPVTKARRGGLAQTSPEEILSQLLKEIVSSTNISSTEINDIIIGNVLQQGSGFISSRSSQILSNLPIEIPLYTVNRLCNSGLQAIINANNEIVSGQSEVVLAGGVESMSLYNFNSMLDKNLLKKENITDDEEIQKLLLPMGVTNENICEKFNISRKEQDEFSYYSHLKASNAQKKGLFKGEIFPIKAKDGEIVSKDDIIRHNATIESLSKLKPVFKKENGTTTAGNSSPLSDGGALCLIVSRRKAKEMGAKILGRIVDYTVVGVPPEIMGIGPSVAIPELLKKSNLSINDIDLFEINEAFAGQAIYCIKTLNIPHDKVNIHGGAIALGHPLGCTGARLVVSMLNELEIYNKKRGIVSMCVGTGMGAACLIEKE